MSRLRPIRRRDGEVRVTLRIDHHVTGDQMALLAAQECYDGDADAPATIAELITAVRDRLAWRGPTTA